MSNRTFSQILFLVILTLFGAVAFGSAFAKNGGSIHIGDTVSAESGEGGVSIAIKGNHNTVDTSPPQPPSRINPVAPFMLCFVGGILIFALLFIWWLQSARTSPPDSVWEDPYYH